MKFVFENFGFVDKGEIELSDLTIICGANNTGKTYISYGIYGLIRNFKRYVNINIPPSQTKSLKNNGSIEIDLNIYKDKIGKYIEKSSDVFTEHLTEYFSAPEEFFKDSSVGFSIDKFKLNLDKEFNRVVGFGNKETLRFDKQGKDQRLSIVLQIEGKGKLQIPERILSKVISDSIVQILFDSILPKPFVVTSERTGISLFYKELDVSKNRIFKQLAASEDINPIDLLNSMRSRYAEPIDDNIKVIRDYEDLSKRKSFLKENKAKYKYVLDALQDLLCGSFKSVNKQLIFSPKKERMREKVAVPVYLTSSSIKSLFLIDFYVNCLAEKNGLLIIDEPELNLHPENQRKMASLLAKLINSGIKVLVTTHSDYLLRELNNRIMLSNKIDNKNDFLLKNKISIEEILKPSQVKAYCFGKNHAIVESKVDKFGINMEIFDDVISNTNALSNEIYYNIKE